MASSPGAWAAANAGAPASIRASPPSRTWCGSTGPDGRRDGLPSRALAGPAREIRFLANWFLVIQILVIQILVIQILVIQILVIRIPAVRSRALTGADR
ncbi:hypothetical protein GCM10009801_58220 [Streptomyces albiaxialis]|uniref:Uncharacterized protein n=1 Tax=Streptomyces albiaxialis TaxID=329523 RepID=A0ABN2WGL9_9ACTN